MRSDTFIESVCVECGITFTQRDDPGSKREYHNNACRQRAYRRRNAAKQRQYKWQQEEAWAREESRKQKERERSERRRTGREHVPEGVPAWCMATGADDKVRAAKRRLAFDLMKRACWPNANESEADADRKMADKIRRRYKL